MKEAKRILFFDVDTQYDFINPKGKLYAKGAEKTIPNLKKLTEFADNKGIVILSTVDTHTRNDPEFKDFPPHCVAGTNGQRKIKQTIAKKTRQMIIKKNTIEIFTGLEPKKQVKDFDIAYVYGIATDYCVKTACLGLVKHGLKTYLITDAIKEISKKAGTAALKLLKRKGVIFLKTKGVISKTGSELFYDKEK